jgi:hypothetical protein
MSIIFANTLVVMACTPYFCAIAAVAVFRKTHRSDRAFHNESRVMIVGAQTMENRSVVERP